MGPGLRYGFNDQSNATRLAHLSQGCSRAWGGGGVEGDPQEVGIVGISKKMEYKEG
jgi:hypothetical protein